MSSLFEIGFGVDLNLFRRQRRTGRIAAGRIANGGRKVTDQEDHRVAEILQLTKLIEHHRVTDVNVGSRGIQTELATQLGAGRLGAGQLLLQFAFDQKRVGTAGNRGHCLLDFGRHFVFLFFGTGGFNRHRYGIPKKAFSFNGCDTFATNGAILYRTAKNQAQTARNAGLKRLCPKCKFFFHIETALCHQTKIPAWFGATSKNGCQKAPSAQFHRF